MRNFYEFKGYQVRIEYDRENKTFIYQKLNAPNLEPKEHEAREPIAASKKQTRKGTVILSGAFGTRSIHDFPVIKITRKILKNRG